MRASYTLIPEGLIRQRRRQGIDKFDEMWEGELHMTPMPSWLHHRESDSLVTSFRMHWEKPGEGLDASHVGIRPPDMPEIDLEGEKVPASFRGPDLVFLLKGYEDRVQEGWIVGPSDAVIEIRSPGDETYKKFPFFHALGNPEVIVVHRDTKAVEVHVRGANGYDRLSTSSDGSITSRVLDTAFRTEANPAGGSATLRLRRVRLPEREGTA